MYIVAEVGWNNFMTTKSNSNLEGHQREEETDGTKIQQQQLGTFITIVVREAKTLMELADSDGAESGDGGTAERRRRNVWNSSRPRIATRREGTMGRRERDCAL